MSKNKVMLGAMAMAMAVPAVVIPASANVDVKPTANDVSDFEYKEIDGGIEISEYIGESLDVVIPDTIDGKDVVSIGSSSFFRKNIESVVIPNNVEMIGFRAFQSNNLTEIIIPEKVKIFGNYAFSENNLKEVTIPKGLKELGEFAFESNKLETVVLLAKELEKFGKFAFSYNELETIDFLPESIETIPMGAFEENNFGVLIIPDHLKRIETSAFYDSNITSLSLPEGIHLSDGDNNILSSGQDSYGAFENNNISKVEFRHGEGFTYIGTRSFYKNKINKISIPKNVINIRNHAFRDNNLTEVEIWNPEIPIENNSFLQNVSYGYQLTFKGFNPSTAKDLATEHQYTFEELNDIPEEPSEPEEPTEPEEPSETPQWSFDNTDGEFNGVVPSLTVMGGKSVNEIEIKNVEWVSKETEIETELGNIILKPDNKGNTLVEIPNGLGDSTTSKVLNVEQNGTNFMDITVVPTPKLDFDFDI